MATKKPATAKLGSASVLPKAGKMSKVKMPKVKMPKVKKKLTETTAKKMLPKGNSLTRKPQMPAWAKMYKGAEFMSGPGLKTPKTGPYAPAKGKKK